ncbi:MAG: acyl-CoA dehydrogenase family protein [Pseudomonadales bacterium]|jgi:alkylation response protein AidB-like acyl-CoA dehydrogenase|nr:acyl-CoA dehydrogenase family protein [Pseudomonadales bacterium]
MNEPAAEQVREEARAWLAEHWDSDLPLAEWRRRLVSSGWGCPTWPAAWFGKGLSEALGEVVQAEFRRAGAVGVASSGVRMLAAATLLEHGSEEQKARLLPRILTGEDTWCQLFSEPGSGSDLAGLTTRAELNRDTWIVNGQKVWTTSAHHARYGMLLARTDWDVPKHRGLSFFVLEIEQPGVEVRPLRQMNGHASFNEVFMTDARVPRDMLVGKPGGGWQVALTTLAHERRLADGMRTWGQAERGEGRVYRELREEQARVMEPYKWYPQRAGRVDLILPVARASGRLPDPVVRQEIARALMLERAAQWTARRARAARALGQPPGPEGSLGKLAASVVARAAARAHAAAVGPDALLAGENAPAEGMVAEVLLSVPAISIAGGTDEIQRNIIAERVLGLPKEPRDDVDVPFRDVRRNPSNVSR